MLLLFLSNKHNPLVNYIKRNLVSRSYCLNRELRNKNFEMAATVMKVEAEVETCCICGNGGELLTPEEYDANVSPSQVPLRTMLLQLNANKVVPEGRLCMNCASRANDAYEFSNSLNSKAAPPLSEKIRALRRRLHELTQKIDVFIVVGGPGTSGAGAAAYSEDDIIMVEKDALAAATLADEEDVEHGRNTRGDAVYQCSVCPMFFQRVSDLRVHLSTHPADALHSCWTCGAQFTSRAALRDHSSQHAAPAAPSCQLCHTVTHTQADLRRHEASCPARCPVCSLELGSRSELSAHAAASHGRTCDPPHVCPACFATLPTADLLSAHLLKHRQAKQFVCGYGDCVLRFGTRNNLMAHIRKCHAAELPPEPETAAAHSCDHCDRTYATAAALKRHARVHERTVQHHAQMEGGDTETEMEGVQYLIAADGEEGEVEYLEVETLEDAEYLIGEEEVKPNIEHLQ